MRTNFQTPLPPDESSLATKRHKSGTASPQSGRAASGGNTGGLPVEVHDYMKRMSPLDCSGTGCGDEIPTLSAIMCSIMMLNSVIERTGNRILESHGLTMPQWLALGCISHAGEEGIPHSQLGQRLMLSKAPITGIVDRLERSGLVERHTDTRDRRISRVVATAGGSATWWQVKNALRESGNTICGDCLDDDEQQQLLDLLSRIMSAFAAHDPMLLDQHKTELAPQEAPSQ